jgi:hypothetical protein
MAIRSILDLYPEVRQELGARIIGRRMASLYCDVAHASFCRGAGHNTRIFLAKAMRLQPMNLRFYGLYAASFLRPSQALVARRIWRALQRIPIPFRTSAAGQQIGISRG